MFRKKIYKNVKFKNLNIYLIHKTFRSPYIIYVRVSEGQFKRQNTCTGALYIYMYAYYKFFCYFFFDDVLMYMIKKLYYFSFVSGRKDNSGYRLNG